MTSLESKVWDEYNARQATMDADPDDIYTQKATTDHERREEFLDTVSCIINGPREQDYGKAIDNFGRIAQMWSAYLGKEITVHDVAACLALLKIARIANSPNKGDSWLDLAGYATIGGTL